MTTTPPIPPPLPSAPAPVDADRRLHALDALRGFALLGIFLMNIEWFTRPPQHMGSGIDPGATGLDHAVALGVYVLVQGKFWVLFSLLFGMGFALMSGRAASAPAFRRVYLRRCLALLGFGLLHGLLLWDGDILHAYALGGLMLMALDGIPRRAWPWLGAGLYVTVAGMLVVYGLVLGLVPPEAQPFADMAAEQDREAAAAAAALSGGSWPEAVAANAHAFATITLPGLFVLLPMVLGVFMLGAWLYGTGRFADVAAHRAWFVRLAAWTLPPGAALMAASLAVGTSFEGMREAGPMTLATALSMLASLPLALAYLALFALALGTRALARPLRWLAPAGRMALTHYLLQSLVAALLFHGWGLGLWGQVGRAGQVAIVFAVFIAQVLASHWWLARFRFGPMEWLWRRMTYGAPPAMRRA